MKLIINFENYTFNRFDGITSENDFYDNWKYAIFTSDEILCHHFCSNFIPYIQFDELLWSEKIKPIKISGHNPKYKDSILGTWQRNIVIPIRAYRNRFIDIFYLKHNQNVLMLIEIVEKEIKILEISERTLETNDIAYITCQNPYELEYVACSDLDNNIEVDFPRNKYPHEKMDFGKYEGRTIEWVKRNDPAYFIWLIDEADFHCLSPIRLGHRLDEPLFVNSHGMPNTIRELSQISNIVRDREIEKCFIVDN